MSEGTCLTRPGLSVLVSIEWHAGVITFILTETPCLHATSVMTVRVKHILIDHVAAMKGDNALGSIHRSVCPSGFPSSPVC